MLAIPARCSSTPSATNTSWTISSSDQPSGSRDVRSKVSCAVVIAFLGVGGDLDAKLVKESNRPTKRVAHLRELLRIADQIVDLFQRFLDVLFVQLCVIVD